MEKMIAECCKCGIVIEFADETEFEKLVDSHVHVYTW